MLFFRPKISFVCVLCVSVFVGCGGEPKGGPRQPTYPITATVHVDGNPAPQIQVVCHKVGTTTDAATQSAAYTDAEGNFSIGTYESGDGAPTGEYKLTFIWGQIGLMSGRYERKPDKLKGRYSDVEKSEFSVIVKEGEPCDLGVIALSTK